jgi:Protein of unknown function (DUF1566)
MNQTRKMFVVALIAWSFALLLTVNAHADCDDNIKRTTPTTDFEFLSGGAVVRSKVTGLEWKRCPEGMTFNAGSSVDHSMDRCNGTASTFNLESSKQFLAKATAEARRSDATDWRLPTMDELASIVEEACTIPAINTVVFPDTPVTWFWADSPKVLPSGGNAWGIGFGAGGYYVGSDEYGAVRLVRKVRQ